MSRCAFVLSSLVVVLIALTPISHAAPLTYIAYMDGPSEAPPNNSPAIGSAQVDIDTEAHIMRIRANFTGLLGNTTAAHVHGPTGAAGTGTASAATQVPTFTGFPLGVTSGMMDQTFDTLASTTWNPAFVTAHGGSASGAEAAFATYLAEGRLYFNVHSDVFPGGEIRGFLAIPEPGSAGLLAVAGLFALARRRSDRCRG
jgi:hypothetical protein